MTSQENAAANVPNTSAACPLCGKSVKIKANGEFSRHGHRNIAGTGGGHCRSTGCTTPAEAIALELAFNEGVLKHWTTNNTLAGAAHWAKQARRAIEQLSAKLAE
jgi:hypothetical protein